MEEYIDNVIIDMIEREGPDSGPSLFSSRLTADELNSIQRRAYSKYMSQILETETFSACTYQNSVAEVINALHPEHTVELKKVYGFNYFDDNLYQSTPF